MLRRDLIAALLGLLPVTGLRSILAAVEASLTDEAGSAGDDPTTETRTAVVDRIEDDVAVLLFEDEGTQETVEASVLPEPAREAGTVLRVPDGDSLALATVDRAATARRRQDAQDRFDELAEPAPDPNGSNGSTNRTGA